MAESQRYRLPGVLDTFVTEGTPDFYAIKNTKGQVYATVLNGQIFSSSSDPVFNSNLANGRYASTIRESLNSAAGTQTRPNVSQSAPQAPQQGGTSSQRSTSQQSQSKSADLRYPADIATTSQDRIKFVACKMNERFSGGYKTDVRDGLEFEFPEPKPIPIQSEPPVYIGIQGSISDQNGVDWGGDSINAIQSAAFAASLGFMQNKESNESLNGIGDKLKDLKDQILKAAGNNTGKIQKLFAAEAASINNILARTDGVVLNPNLELLFNAPTLRPFSFQFRMSARDSDEAVTIKQIIKYFKKHMAAQRGSDRLFLKAPNVFKIEYQKGTGVLHQSINRIKDCALTNFSVDYTPLNSYMTYNDPDATMVSYTLSMQFQELVPIYYDEYNDNHQIGF